MKIETITAFVASDAEGEGIMGMNTRDGWVPFIGADEARIKSLYPMAQKISEMSGKSFKVIRFSSQEDITKEIKEKYEPKPNA